ncbi:MAG TPA: hypothetical protein VGC29_05030 [Flavisolibacter sp.]
MERIQALIDKLYNQKLENSNPAQLLFTVQLLQTELLKLQQKNGSLGTAKVAVTLPVNMNFSEEVVRPVISEMPVEETAIKEIKAQQPQTAPQAEAVQQSQPVVEKSQQEIKETVTPDPQEYLLRKPAVPEIMEEPVSKYAPRPQQVLNPAFSTAVETPTLVQHQPREIHEVISEKKESLNDRLKEEKREVAHTLKDTPIKDLRKGIGINDRFTFVNELFRGDDAMYERSIKTINGFHILSEAEYWINRELKFKLGWNDNKETVQHFYHLVRRRFA